MKAPAWLSPLASPVLDQAANEPVEIIVLHRMKHGQLVVVEQRPFARLRPPREPSSDQVQRWTRLLACSDSMRLLLPLPPSNGAAWPRFPRGVSALASQLGIKRPSLVEDLKKALIWRASRASRNSEGTFL